jgi:DsbC/DsbD-like thiol-disulfide interchange protein
MSDMMKPGGLVGVRTLDARVFVVCCAIVGLIVVGGRALAGPKELEGLTIELVSEDLAIRAGEPFAVGLSISHSKGFHTYWKNPGIVGVPTGIEWELPAGFKAGPIEWPAPQLTKMAVYPVYGYEGKILLPVRITPPPDWSPGPEGKAFLKAKTSWMCCSATCHPGFTDLTIGLPAAPTDSAGERAFTKWRPEFERARRSRPVKTNAWQVSASRVGDSVTVEVKAGDSANRAIVEALESIYFFSGDGLIDSRAEQKIERIGEAGIRLSLTVSEFEPVSKAAEKTPNPRLAGVLSAERSWLSGKKVLAITLNVPLE